MKTKHLLTGLVLPALFAACTSEEIVPQQEVAKVDLGNRPVAGNVVFNFGDAESRGTVADRAFNAIDFVKGEDGFGARIIDEYSPVTVPTGYTLDHASRNYGITNVYASSNYKYVNNGGAEWITDALMVEGNYMFYYPYNEANLARTPNQVVLPLAQTVKPNEEDGYRNPIKDLYEGVNPAIVGYTFLSATDQEAYVTPALHHVFAYPQITLTNNYKYLPTGAVNEDKNYVAKEITVTKIIIESTEFKTKGKINHEGLVTALRDFSLTKKTYSDGTTTLWEKVDLGTWNNNTKNGIYAAKTADIVDWASNTTDGTITVTFEGGLTLAPAESYSFNIVAPAADYSTNKMKFTVYLSNDKMFSGKFDLYNTNLSFAPSKRYPTQAYDFPTNGTPSIKAKPGSLATIEFKKGNAIVDAKDPAELIDNAEEFEAFLKTIKNNTTTIKEVATLEEANEANEFVLTRNATSKVASMKINAAVVELINKYLTNGSVEFLSKMQVSDEANTVVLSKANYTGGLEILAGNVTANAGIVTGSTVVKGGTLTVPSTSTVALGAITVKGGELVVKKDNFVGLGLHNVTVTKTLNTAGTAVIATGTLTIDGKTTTANFNGITMDAGEVVIAAESTANIGSSANTQITDGKITNNGTLLVWSAYEMAEGVEFDQNGVVDVTTKPGAEFINNGTINNYKNLVVTNKGTVNMKDVKANLIANGEGGNIDNTVLAYVKVNSNNRDDQTVWYVHSNDVTVTAADAIDYKTYAINALEINKEFTLDKAASKTNGLAWISTVKFTDGSKFYVKGAQKVGMTNFIIEGAVELYGWGMNNESSVQLVRAADVNLKKNSHLTVSGIKINTTTPQVLNFIGEAYSGTDKQAIVTNNGVIDLGGGTKDNIDVKGTAF